MKKKTTKRKKTKPNKCKKVKIRLHNWIDGRWSWYGNKAIEKLFTFDGSSSTRRSAIADARRTLRALGYEPEF